MKALIPALILLAAPVTAEELTIATGGHYPPYILFPGTEEATGLDKVLMDEICARGGYDCTWVDLPMNDIFQALARGDVDVVAGGFGYTEERDQIVDFTCPYNVSDDNTGVFFALSPEADLLESTVGVLDASLYKSAMERVGREVVTYPTEAAALNGLLAGEVDVTFGSHNMEGMAGGRSDVFLVGEYPTFSGGTVLGVSEDAPDLRRALDDLLAEISADGTLSELQMEWLGKDQGDIIARCASPVPLT